VFLIVLYNHTGWGSGRRRVGTHHGQWREVTGCVDEEAKIVIYSPEKCSSRWVMVKRHVKN